MWLDMAQWEGPNTRGPWMGGAARLGVPGWELWLVANETT